MKKLFVFAIALYLISCSSTPSTGTFGNQFEKSSVMSYSNAVELYNSGKDTIYQIEGEIGSVCQHGACWLMMEGDSGTLKIDTEEKFKLPKDGKGKKAIATGKFTKTKSGKLQFVTTGVVIE